jgi:hypothetical protein
MRDGLPDPKRQGTHPVADVLQLDTIINAVRSMPLQPADAGRIVEALKARGLIETTVVKAGPGTEALVAFLERFWSYDESPYIREKLAHEHRLGRRHTYDMLLHVRTHWKPYFTDRRLAEINRADLQDSSLWLKERKVLKGKTVNNVLAAGTVGLRWAYGNALIPTNPPKVSCSSRARPPAAVCSPRKRSSGCLPDPGSTNGPGSGTRSLCPPASGRERSSPSRSGTLRTTGCSSGTRGRIWTG